MLQHERIEYIKQQLFKHKQVLVLEMSSILNVSEETIRRDLTKLENQNFAKKVYGGAIINEDIVNDIYYENRITTKEEEKKSIAQKLELIIPNDSIIMCDTSSTVYIAIENLIKKKEIKTVISNSIHILYMLSSFNYPGISTGGILKKNSFALLGSTTLNTIASYSADFCIISCKGISFNFGLSDSNNPEADVKKKMYNQSKKLIVLADDSKFDKNALEKVINLQEIDYIITNKKPSKSWLDFCEANNIILIY